MFEIKSFERKMSLISEFELLIFSLFESIALYVYLKKKKLFCIVNVPPKIFTGYIFYKLNSIRF